MSCHLDNDGVGKGGGWGKYVGALVVGGDPHFDEPSLIGGVVAVEMEIEVPIEGVGRGCDGVGFQGRAVEFEADGFSVGVGGGGAPGVDVDAGAVGDTAHAGVHGAGWKGVGCQIGFGGVGAGDRARGVEGLAIQVAGDFEGGGRGAHAGGEGVALGDGGGCFSDGEGLDEGEGVAPRRYPDRAAVGGAIESAGVDEGAECASAGVR